MLPDISWVHRTPAEMKTATDVTLRHKRSGLDAVFAVPPDERTFANTIAALQFAEGPLADHQQQLDVLVGVHPDAVIREAAQAEADRIDEENVKMDFDRRLWNAVQEWQAHREPLEDADRKLAHDTIRDLRRMGFGLDDAKFERLKSNVTALRKMQTEFEKAINDWEDSIVVTREQLAGLPERFIEGLAREGDGYRVSLEYPEFFPYMRQAHDDASRLALATKNLLKGGRENAERLVKMVRLRQENASLLGYASHADYVAEPRMVKSAATVKAFLERIIDRLVPAARHELSELIDMKRRVRGLERREPLLFHEQAYWGHALLQERYGFDAEQVKEYFPLKHVIDGMFEVYQRVLGLTFTRVADASLWHPDAQLYAVADGERTYGHFVLDLHPRKGKYGHAAAFPVVLGRAERDGYRVSGLIALVCNFPKPTASNPSLLTHDEVETLLHEFGHVMHALLSGGTWQRQNGFGVSLDFVETPSQLFEEWAWDPAVLSLLSSHFTTGERMPEDLMRKLLAARHHMQANYYLQQAVKALYDFRLHGEWMADQLDADVLTHRYRDMRLELESVELPDSSLFPAGWTHMADYDAGYYSYLWSKVYALDLYSVFKANPLSPTVGRRYRSLVLEPGASKEELALVVAFLDREPSDEAFLRALGIAE